MSKTYTSNSGKILKPLKGNKPLRLREVFKGYNGENVTKLYNVLSVIRGNDMSEQRELKKITVAIRSYVGLPEYRKFEIGYKDNVNVGYTLEQQEYSRESVIAAINKLMQNRWHLSDEDREVYTGHYYDHLRDAVEVIGKDNLIAFVNKVMQ